MLDCPDLKEKLEQREKEVTMEFQDLWAQWERTGSVDLVVMLDPLDLKELKERQELQEIGASQVQMVFQAKREPRVKEEYQEQLVPKV